jgi:hypothetical protein
LFHGIVTLPGTRRKSSPATAQQKIIMGTMNIKPVESPTGKQAQEIIIPAPNA